MTFIRKTIALFKSPSNKYYIRILDALLAAILIVVATSLGLIDDIDRRSSDWLYQNPSERSDDIVVIGIDSATLKSLGPLRTWGRREISRAIEYLNQNEDSRPAVIGIDVMFTGENPMYAQWSKALVVAAEKCHNVVVASKTDIDENKDVEAKNNDPYYPWNRTWPWDAPYDALLAVADTGHIDAPAEPDGIVRHALLYVDVEEKGRLYSFGKVIYEKWCEFKGIEQNPLPKTVGNGLYYLPLTAENYSRGFNFLDLVEGKIPPEVYKGKIVLIGPYATGMMDESPTAINRSDLMYGLDIHANVIEAFQKGFFPYEISKTPQLVLLFLIAFFSELFFREGKMRSVVIAWLTICFGWIGLCKLCYMCEILLHVSWVPFFVSILFIGAVMTNYYIHAAEEDIRISATFGRYFDPTVMKELLAGKNDLFKLGGKQQNIAVLFVDIRGFTSMSDKMSASTVVEILNHYLALTTECIFRHHGTLDKFIGDATMAFWNLPPEQKPVHLACRAAFDMIKGTEKLNKEIHEKFGVNIYFGIGINWGRAVVGNIGTEKRMDYTAIGDTVNTAARLESAAEGGQILISRAVADILGDSAEFVLLNKDITLKGKEKGLEIFVLKSLKE